MHGREQVVAANNDVARRLFYGGLACLPWVWILNLVYFRHALLDPSAPAELRQWLFRSLTGAVIMTVVFIIWISVFQTQYQAWGETGQSLLVYRKPQQWWLQTAQ